jgi:hypothetical protein
VIRVCNGEDEFSQAEDRSPCTCGRRYDDVDRMVIFPHQRIGGEMVTVHIDSPAATGVLAQMVAQLREAGQWSRQ